MSALDNSVQTDSPVLSRRDALKAGVALAAGAVMNETAARADDKAADLKSGWIDAHSHIWTRDVKSYPLANKQTVDVLKPASFTTEELLATAKKENVSRVVLIAHSKFYAWDNSYMTDSAKKYPGRFRIVGMVDDSKPKPDAAMRKLLKQGVTGFRIVPWIRGRDKWLDNDGMKAMWKCAAETGQSMCCLINPEDLPAVDKMCKANPETSVVIDHFARIGIDGKMRESDLKNLCKLAKHKKTAIKISAYYALGKKTPPHTELLPMIRRLYDSFGAKRLMWASDSPYQLEGKNTYKSSIALVRDKIDFVSKSEREWLLRKTAERVFFFDT